MRGKGLLGQVIERGDERDEQGENAAEKRDGVSRAHVPRADRVERRTHREERERHRLPRPFPHQSQALMKMSGMVIAMMASANMPAIISPPIAINRTRGVSSTHPRHEQSAPHPVTMSAASVSTHMIHSAPFAQTYFTS